MRSDLKSTTDSSVYKKQRKKYLAKKGLINCSICPPHKKENATKKDYMSWKRHRKTKWKPK